MSSTEQPSPKKPIPHHLGRTNYKRFAPIEAEFKDWRPQHGYHSNYTAELLHENPKDKKALLDELKKLGFHRISADKHSGIFALVVETNDHQMIRISSAMDEPARDKSPDVLQPIFAKEFKRKATSDPYRIEVLPKVHTMADIIADPELAKAYGMKDAKRECAELTRRLIVENLQRDQFLCDFKSNNLCVVQDEKGNNVPLIIDAGAKQHMLTKDWFPTDDLMLFRGCVAHNLDLPEVQPYLQDNEPYAVEMGYPAKELDESNARAYLEFLSKQRYDTQLDYAGAQEAHKKRQELDNGMKGAEHNAAILADFLDKRNPSLTGAMPVYQQIIEAGASHSEFGDIARNADPSGKGFCHDILEQAKNRGVVERKP